VGQGVLIEVLESHSFRHTALGPTRLDGWSARHRDVYLTTHNIRKEQTSTHLATVEPTIPARQLLHLRRLRPCCHWDRSSFIL